MPTRPVSDATPNAELWVLSVQQPSATAIVREIKDVENRSKPFDGERWVLIVSTKKKPTTGKRHNDGQPVEDGFLSKLKAYNKSAGFSDDYFPGHGTYEAAVKLPLGHVVGVALMECYSQEDYFKEFPVPSPWYDGVKGIGNVYAWVVKTAFHFDKPVEYNSDAGAALGMETLCRLEMALTRDSKGFCGVVHGKIKKALEDVLASPRAVLFEDVDNKSELPPLLTWELPPVDPMDTTEQQEKEQELVLEQLEQQKLEQQHSAQPQQQQEQELELVPPLPVAFPVTLPLPVSSGASTDSLASFLDANGCAAISLDGVEGMGAEEVHAFKTSLDAAAQTHVTNTFNRYEIEGYPELHVSLADQKIVWSKMSPEQRFDILRRFDLTTLKGANAFFVSDERKKALDPFPSVKDYVEKLVMYARQGENVGARGNSHVSVATNAGFGIWNVIVTQFGNTTLLRIRDFLREAKVNMCVTGVPHVIYKPSDGGPLSEHHDQMTAKELIKNLDDHCTSGDSSVMGWVSKWGCQMLAHVVGGDQGCTTTLWPMDCKTLLFCMEKIKRCSEGSDLWNVAWNPPKGDTSRAVRERFFSAKSGPYFLPWVAMTVGTKKGRVQVEGPLNVLLRENNYRALQVMSIRPADDVTARRPYVAWWPVGFPHWSTPNKERRLSLTVNLRMDTPANRDKALPHVVQQRARLNALAVLAHPNGGVAGTAPLSDEERQQVDDARAHFERERKAKQVYAEGPTHKMAYRTERLQSQFAVPPGPFASLAPNREEVADFLTKAGWPTEADERTPSRLAV
jgi:hypothetical protein